MENQTNKIGVARRIINIRRISRRNKDNRKYFISHLIRVDTGVLFTRPNDQIFQKPYSYTTPTP